MTTEKPDPSRQIRIVGGEHASIAVSAQILGRKKAKAAAMAQRAGSPAFVLGPQGLGGIFNDEQILARGNLKNRIHIRHLAKQIERDNGARPLGR